MSKYPVAPLADVHVTDLQWLTGTWTGLHGEDQIEEHWSPLAYQALQPKAVRMGGKG
jgi:hypothetical protein